jgi:hypothetical protein
MKKQHGFQYSIAAGWLVTALATVLISVLIIPSQSRSPHFWHRVGWTEFLLLMFWGSVGFYLFTPRVSKDNVKRFGGIAPTISIVTAIYVALSFSAMLLHAFLPQSDISNRVHWIAQILLFSLAAMCAVFLSMARAGATSGLALDSSKTMSPRQIHDLLALHETSLTSQSDDTQNELKSRIKQLREAILCSLHDSSNLAQLPEYQEYCLTIRGFCTAIDRYTKHGGDETEVRNELDETARYLTTRVQFISSKQVRR